MKHKHSGDKRIETELGTYYACEICGEPFESWKRKITNFVFIKFDFYCGRGEKYISHINGLINTCGGLGVVWLLIFGFSASSKAWVLIIIWLAQKALVYWLGHKDYHKWKIAQREGLYGFKYAPLAVEQLRRLKNIERVVNPEEFREESVVDYFKDKKVGK